MQRNQLASLVVVLLIVVGFSDVIIIDSTVQAPPPPQIDPLLQLKNWTRSYDGTGNNVNFTNWGSAGQAESRFCTPNYTDGFSAMQPGLPNPRSLSNVLGNAAAGITLSRPNWNMLFPIWGQFV